MVRGKEKNTEIPKDRHTSILPLTLPPPKKQSYLNKDIKKTYTNKKHSDTEINMRMETLAEYNALILFILKLLNTKLRTFT